MGTFLRRVAYFIKINIERANAVLLGTFGLPANYKVYFKQDFGKTTIINVCVFASSGSTVAELTDTLVQFSNISAGHAC